MFPISNSQQQTCDLTGASAQRQSLPIFLNLAGKRCLVIGGGEAAIAKIRQLFDAGAKITVVTENAHATLIDWAIGDALILVRRTFVADDFQNVSLAFIADEDSSQIGAAVTLAHQAGALVNVVDGPEHSDFIMPAHVDRGPITVAIGTQGLAPTLAVKLRQEMDALLPERLGELATFAGRYRDAVKSTKSSPVARRKFWQGFFDGPVAEAVLAGDEALAFDGMLRAINKTGDNSEDGRVTFIAAPEFDIDLLPIGALRRLYRADVVAFSGRLPIALANKIRREAELVKFGADEAQALADLSEKANSGARVVILSDQASHLEAAEDYLSRNAHHHSVERFDSGQFKTGNPFVSAATVSSHPLAAKLGGAN